MTDKPLYRYRYKLLGAGDYDTFVKLVNLQMERGWAPQGGVQVVLKGDTERYYQAMMIEELIEEL